MLLEAPYESSKHLKNLLASQRSSKYPIPIWWHSSMKRLWWRALCASFEVVDNLESLINVDVSLSRYCVLRFCYMKFIDVKIVGHVRDKVRGSCALKVFIWFRVSLSSHFVMFSSYGLLSCALCCDPSWLITRAISMRVHGRILCKFMMLRQNSSYFFFCY